MLNLVTEVCIHHNFAEKLSLSDFDHHFCAGTSYMDTLLRNVNPNARSLPTNVDAVQSILASPLTTTDTASRQHASHPWPSDSSTSFPTPSDLVAREADLREIGSIADEPWPVGDPRWEVFRSWMF
jgi:hypothetical protein